MKRSFVIEKDWITKAGLRAVCAVVHNSHRCGYVAVEKDHPLFGKDYDEAHELIEIEVHGGLTHANHQGKYPVEAEGLTWFGFDCAHSGDGLMGSRSMFRGGNDPVRSQDYVEHECESLAKQLADNLTRNNQRRV